MYLLTTGNDDPNEIQEKVVKPKVISLWPAVGQSLVVMVKHACRVVKNVAIYLAQRNHYLKRMPQGMLSADEECNHEGKRAPEDLQRSATTVYIIQSGLSQLV